MEKISELIELMDKYLELQQQKLDMRKTCLDVEKHCDWNNLHAQMERVGLLDEYVAAEKEQRELLGVLPYYSDFGDDETEMVFNWLKDLIKQAKK